MTTQNSKTVTINVNGVDVTLPKLDALPLGIMRKTRKSTDDIERFFIIIESLYEEGSVELAALDSLSGEEEITNFMNEWTGTEEAKLGE